MGSGWKEPTGTRWVDINKGDEDQPVYRSRLVAKDLNTDKRGDLGVATQPLEALKLLISMAMTEGVGYQKGKEEPGVKLEFIDIKWAYLQALARRDYTSNCQTRMPSQVSAPS